MSIYQLPKLPKFNFPKLWRIKAFWLIFSVVLLAAFFGFAGWTARDYLAQLSVKALPQVVEKETVVEKQPIYIPQTTQEEAIINVVKEVSPSAVSIIITKDVPVLEQFYSNPFDQFFGPGFDIQIPQLLQKGVEKREIGGGSGFIISEDGLVLTNKHVVSDEEADYTVFTTDGEKYPAKVLARDPVRDLAVLKIETEKGIDDQGKLLAKPFPAVRLGDSGNLQIGQTVVAIGNALGEFKNTVSVGVISGLGRTVTASGGGITETIEDVIQTDAAINKGNSGGPLLNLKGEVVGVNFAVAESAQSIGFSIPINAAKKDIEQVEKLGKISYPFLGVRHVLINKTVKTENNLPVDYGAWIQKGKAGEPAITPGSAAQAAGLQEGDIILEFNGEKITVDNALTKIIAKYDAGAKVSLKIIRDGKEKNIPAILGERKE
ncbi:MAG: trypsin-like peptidase domain-containing protein [bacterium]